MLTNGQYLQGSGINEMIPPGQSITMPAMLHVLRAGTYTIKVSIPGFKEQSRTLRLQVGQTLNLDFKLTLDAVLAAKPG